MASAEQCEQALRILADRMAAVDGATRRRNALDRTLSCRLTDLELIFGGHLHDGLLTDIRQVDRPDAQVKLSMTSDDLVALMAGDLSFAPAWASGRIKLDAKVLDLMKLRSIF